MVNLIMRCIHSSHPIHYVNAISFMEDLCQMEGFVPFLWLLEHHPIYTTGAGDRGKYNFDVVRSSRGGGITYHGANQRVVYIVARISMFKMNVVEYVVTLQRWIAKTLRDIGVTEPKQSHGSVWIGDAKIAFIGIRVRNGVVFHGFSVNISVDLSCFAYIMPCGKDYAATSLEKEGFPISLLDFDKILLSNVPESFGSISNIEEVLEIPYVV